MFNEKSNIWLDLYKGIIMVGFWMICAGIVLYGAYVIFLLIGVKNASGIHFGLNSEITFLLLAQFIGLIIGAFLWYVIGMLSLNFFSNVQLIREHLENKEHSVSSRA